VSESDIRPNARLTLTRSFLEYVLPRGCGSGLGGSGARLRGEKMDRIVSIMKRRRVWRGEKLEGETERSNFETERSRRPGALILRLFMFLFALQRPDSSLIRPHADDARGASLHVMTRTHVTNQKVDPQAAELLMYGT
jgi:hypothetical protein